MTDKLPDAANLEWLRKEAKRRLRELQKSKSEVKLADAQLALARQYGFSSWRALKAYVDALTLTGQAFAHARKGETKKLAALLDEHDALLTARSKPYGWTLLHEAASHRGHLPVVDMLLQRGLDVNAKEQGDDTVAMHWAAAAGAVDVVRRLIAAGSDVIGEGDDHALGIIGWATCWDGCNDDGVPVTAYAGFPRVSRDTIRALANGAPADVFTALALDDYDLAERLHRADAKGAAQPRRGLRGSTPR